MINYRVNSVSSKKINCTRQTKSLKSMLEKWRERNYITVHITHNKPCSKYKKDLIITCFSDVRYSYLVLQNIRAHAYPGGGRKYLHLILFHLVKKTTNFQFLISSGCMKFKHWFFSHIAILHPSHPEPLETTLWQKCATYSSFQSKKKLPHVIRLSPTNGRFIQSKPLNL